MRLPRPEQVGARNDTAFSSLRGVKAPKQSHGDAKGLPRFDHITLTLILSHRGRGNSPLNDNRLTPNPFEFGFRN